MNESKLEQAQEKVVFKYPDALADKPTHYCPGCTHGTAHRLVAEVIDELGIRESTIGVGSVGCSVLMYSYVNTDAIEPAHGRAPAVATGIKRVQPDKIVYTYQGDGDLAAIGTTEIVHAAARNEHIAVIFINNAIYGMTGGQLAPTTLPDQRSTSSPGGRNVALAGRPIKVCELLASQDGPVYIARVALDTPANTVRAKAAIKKAFQVQVAGLGFALVEVLSSCPVNWGMSPVQSLAWIGDHMVPYYPLGEYRVTDEVLRVVGEEE